ncbi:hypothetical protein ABZV64_25325 [Streptomyces sp. NPDC004959]|uniref:hypothetical protein n=1 Tax=unclassified Streptomyces TaxID=2593676 RepID=UPI0033A19D41
MSSPSEEVLVALIGGPMAILCGVGLLRSAKDSTNSLVNWSREQSGLKPMEPRTARAITLVIGLGFTVIGGMIFLGGILGLIL